MPMIFKLLRERLDQGFFVEGFENSLAMNVPRLFFFSVHIFCPSGFDSFDLVPLEEAELLFLLNLLVAPFLLWTAITYSLLPYLSWWSQSYQKKVEKRPGVNRNGMSPDNT